MSFAHEGFFSPEIERFRALVRQSETAGPWLAFCRDLSVFGLQALNALEIDGQDSVRVVAATIFTRSHQGMQAAAILAESGLTLDGRALVRGNIECAIALFALAKDPGFVESLKSAHNKERLTLIEVVLHNSSIEAECTPSELAILKTRRVELLNLPEEERRSIIWANVAAQHCPEIYDTMYRIFSNDGTHVTLTALNDRLEFADGPVPRIKVGPDTAKLVNTLNGACGAFLHALSAFALLFPNALPANQISEFSRRFSLMPDKELDW